MKTLICGCCGARAKGKQHWNHDTGYGLCAACVYYLAERNEIDELKGYGTPGVNFAAPLTTDCAKGMLVSWRNVGDGERTYHIGTIKDWDNGTAIISEIDALDERHETAVRCA